jgi:hypothetical protein
MEDTELKFYPALLVQKRRRNKKYKRNEIVKHFFPETENWNVIFFFETKLNEKNSEAERTERKQICKVVKQNRTKRKV